MQGWATDWSLTPSKAVCGHPREAGALFLLAGPQLRQQELPLCISHGGGGGGSTEGLSTTAMANIPNNLFLFIFPDEICISRPLAGSGIVISAARAEEVKEGRPLRGCERTDKARKPKSLRPMILPAPGIWVQPQRDTGGRGCGCGV